VDLRRERHAPLSGFHRQDPELPDQVIAINSWTQPDLAAKPFVVRPPLTDGEIVHQVDDRRPVRD